MKTLENNIKKLQEKRTYIRKGLQNFLDTWEEKTKADEVHAREYLCTYTPENGSEYCLFLETGKNDLQVNWGCNHFSNFSDGCYVSSILSIEEIKEIIKELPKAIERIENEIKDNIKQESNIQFPIWK